MISVKIWYSIFSRLRGAIYKLECHSGESIFFVINSTVILKLKSENLKSLQSILFSYGLYFTLLFDIYIYCSTCIFFFFLMWISSWKLCQWIWNSTFRGVKQTTYVMTDAHGLMSFFHFFFFGVIDAYKQLGEQLPFYHYFF